MPDGQIANTADTSGGDGGTGPGSGPEGTEPFPAPAELSQAQTEPPLAPAEQSLQPFLDTRPPARPLDPVDRNILRLLRADGRMSVRALADQVHVSRANAYARINRLLDDGVIRGFSARIDEERAGQGASAYITLKIVQDSWRSVREQLLRLPGAAHMALVSGDFDVLLLVHTADNRSLRDLVLTRIQSIPEVISTRTLLVFEETDLEPEI
ncbi:Lrp/AsnC family transcriptional regulator [Streptomyces ovatisporus]|uniref:Lrp/AsnC family transcriptional regulator n=1 Tax=Streptomyces ovatisporus TaxID=1128682 RepID=A0ABV9A9L5_9ACTN